ncbi:MAG: hypothetical protein AB1485_06380 [Candidatus Thermoplasmatota archaeon]
MRERKIWVKVKAPRYKIRGYWRSLPGHAIKKLEWSKELGYIEPEREIKTTGILEKLTEDEINPRRKKYWHIEIRPVEEFAKDAMFVDGLADFAVADIGDPDGLKATVGKLKVDVEKFGKELAPTRVQKYLLPREHVALENGELVPITKRGKEELASIVRRHGKPILIKNAEEGVFMAKRRPWLPYPRPRKIRVPKRISEGGEI